MAAAPEMPHLTTAVIVEENQRILMVNENDNGINGWNQPAGHVEPGESLLDAARRETLEETQYQVRLTGLVGIYQSVHPTTGIHYLRVCFTADQPEWVENSPRDTDILAVDWLSVEQLLAGHYPLRSALVSQALADYQAGQRYPLSLIHPMIAPGSL
ncbi:MAG: NUDIX hydrolase [Saccharospirillum sp.]|uniref:NUDIX hydrolase n=1 Tax=Saccharospirillum TaxID=231683 RepID=UPI003299FFB2